MLAGAEVACAWKIFAMPADEPEAEAAEGDVLASAPPSAAETETNPPVIEAHRATEKESTAEQNSKKDGLALDLDEAVEREPLVQASTDGLSAPEETPDIAEEKAVVGSSAPTAERTQLETEGTSKPEARAPVATSVAEEKPALAEKRCIYGKCVANGTSCARGSLSLC